MQVESRLSDIPLLQFKDATTKSGINSTIRIGYEGEFFSYLEILGGGCGAIDYDCDGLVDLAIAGGGLLNKDETLTGLPGELYRSEGGLVFSPVGSLSGFDLSHIYNHGIIVGDYDNDGFDDILVSGYTGVQLLINQGDGTFQEGSSFAGLNVRKWTGCGAFADLNGDGLLDIVLTSYGSWSFKNNPFCWSSKDNKVRDSCSPTIFSGLGNVVFFGNGDKTFRDATNESHLIEKARSLSVAAADLDGDRDVDLYIANDMQPNFVYRNEGKGEFKEIGIRAGAATDPRGVSQGSMGVAIGDCNGDEKFDILVTNFEKELPALYVGKSNLSYRFQTNAANIGLLGDDFVSWGTVFADLNTDGDEDLAIVSGQLIQSRSRAKQKSNLFVNKGKGQFEEITNRSGDFFAQERLARGLISADFDNDGKLDLFVTITESPSQLAHNVTKDVGNYLSVRLIGTNDNRSAIGTTLRLKTAERSWTKQVIGGGSFLSSSDHRVHFGVGKTASLPATLLVQWPNGKDDTIKIDAWDQQIDIVQTPSP